MPKTLDAAWDRRLERIVASYAFVARQGNPLAKGYGDPEDAAQTAQEVEAMEQRRIMCSAQARVSQSCLEL